VLLYGSEVWGTSMVNKINKEEHILFNLSKNMKQENVHIQFCKFSLGVGKRTTNIAVLRELGRYPLLLEVILNIFRYFKYLLKSEDVLLSESLKVSKSLKSLNINSWYGSIESLTQYINIDVEKVKNMKIDLKQKYNFVWRSEIYDRNNKQGGNKLRTYRLFKDNISLEKYLLILNEDERRVLPKFRVSAHNLEIDKGRYIGVKTEDRICKLCNTGVEDETHFLLQCPVLENKRTQIINNIKNLNTNFNNLSNKSKLIWLMSSEDNFIIKNTSSLLCSLFKERDLVLKGN
jgi:hypothetical protein